MAEVVEKVSIVLPTEKRKVTRKSPGSMIIVSKPKIGKTTVMAELENNLILDFEKGSEFVEAMTIQIDSIDKLLEVGRAIKAAGFPYKYITVDTATALEDMCIPLAEKNYSQTPIGKYWFKGKDGNPSGKETYKSILSLPEGQGYNFLRQAFEQVFDFIKKLAPHVIFLCHVKDSQLVKEGVTVMSSDVDLTGKIRRIACSYVDCIGYMTRKGNKNIISFKTDQDISCGARPEHLQNKEIVISEMVNGKLTTYWNQIFID